MKFRVRFTVIFTTLLLGLFGILTILSSQSGTEHPFYLAARQSLFLGLGAALLFGAAAIRFSFFRNNFPWFSALCFIALLILPVCGTKIHGMQGWFRFGALSLQPTELAKPFFILQMAMLLGSSRSEKEHFYQTLLWSALWLAVILIQPDFGTAAVYFIAYFLLLFASGIKIRYLGALAGIGAAGGAFFLLNCAYAWKRVAGFLGSADNWHIRQFELAAARGGWSGSKLGQAFWSNAYLPLPYNDSAYATLTETIGFFGAMLVLCLFAVLIAVLAVQALNRSLPQDSRLFIGGAAILISVQTLIHIGVNLSLLPPTGLTLPLISCGGSSLAGCCILIGMALSAAAERKL